METQLERELAAEREELLEVEEEEEEGGSLERRNIGEDLDEDDEREFESMMGTSEKILVRPGLAKVRSLPANFIYNPPKEKSLDGKLVERRTSTCQVDTRGRFIGSRRVEEKLKNSKNNPFRQILPFRWRSTSERDGAARVSARTRDRPSSNRSADRPSTRATNEGPCCRCTSKSPRSSRSPFAI